MTSIHEDPPLEIFELRLQLAEAHDRIASLEADVQVYQQMTHLGYGAVAAVTKERDRLRASNARLLVERRQPRQNKAA